jgi:hypothetical protein
MAQISFEKGYYIDSTGTKTEGFIRNVGWKYAPASFTFKTSETAGAVEIPTNTITEFLAGNDKYIRILAQYDRSPQDLKSIGVISNPDWVSDRIVLKVLVDGKARLYHYLTKTSSLFFYSVDNSPIEQLVFKNYLKPGDVTQMLANTMYLSQLNTKVRCSSAPPVKQREVAYEEPSLTKHFRKYNICSGDVPAVATNQKKSTSIRVTPGIDIPKMEARRGGRTYDYKPITSVRFGVDLEFALPFKKGKWAVMAEPTFQSFKSTDQNNLSLTYQSFEIPIGLRHKFFLGETQYIFIDAMGLLDFPTKFVHEHQTGLFVEDERGIYGFAAGGGYAFRRFSLEVRHYAKRTRTIGDIFEYNYSKTTAILGFRIFNY